ncbi:MAG: hypothetical protein QOI08_3433 [Actinomycetota bacterium]|nr:hypothetical protein [Actinomycetota bacterium]
MPGRLAAVRFANKTGVHEEPGVAQQPRHHFGREPVRIERHRVPVRALEVHGGIADLEREKKMPARTDDPVELGERAQQRAIERLVGEFGRQDAA